MHCVADLLMKNVANGLQDQPRLLMIARDQLTSVTEDGRISEAGGESHMLSQSMI